MKLQSVVDNARACAITSCSLFPVYDLSEVCKVIEAEMKLAQ